MLIPLETLIARYGLQVEGVLHVGGHHAEEAKAYNKVGFAPVYWVEAEEASYRILQRNIRRYGNQFAVNAVVTDEEKQVVFNHANNGQSSSLLEFGTHSKEHPDVVFTGTTTYDATTIAKLFEQGYIKQCNFVNLDIQGAELLALKGAGSYLDDVKYIYSEVNKRELYKGCVLLGELDEWLGERGFVRKEIEMTPHGWGDAFYVR
jgi:FkbM family methyltransferase